MFQSQLYPIQILRILVFAQKIIKEKESGQYILSVDKKDFIEGSIEMTSSGNGYLLMSEEEDVFIARRNTNRALDGDLVLVCQIKKRNNGKREGEVVEILKRAIVFWAKWCPIFH